MSPTPSHDRDRHWILAELKRRYGSLNDFASTTPLPASHFSVALGAPYPRADRLIAKALGMSVHELWPDRYESDGTRKAKPSRQIRHKASPSAMRGAA